MRDPMKESNPGRPEQNAFTLGAEPAPKSEEKKKNMFGSEEADSRVPEMPEPKSVTKKTETKTEEPEEEEKPKAQKQTAKSKKRAVADLLNSPVFKSDDPNSDEFIKQYTIYLKPKQVKFCKDLCTGIVGVSWSTIVQKMIDSYMEED